MGKQPRKRRLGRLYDDIFGNGVRGAHYQEPIFRQRTDAQKIAEVKEYIASGSAANPPHLAWSLNNSSSLPPRGLIMDMSGSTRIGDQLISTGKHFSFGCWVKPTDPAPVSQSLFVIAKTGSKGPYMGWFGLVSGAAHTVKARFAVMSGSGGARPTLEKKTLQNQTAAALGAWHFFGFSYSSGSSTKVIVQTNATPSASLFTNHAPLTASMKWEKTSLFVQRSGSDSPTLSGTAFHGRVSQAAIWTTALTASTFATAYALNASNKVFAGEGTVEPKYAYDFGFRTSTTYAPSFGNTHITAAFLGGAATYVADGP